MNKVKSLGELTAVMCWQHHSTVNWLDTNPILRIYLHGSHPSFSLVWQYPDYFLSWTAKVIIMTLVAPLSLNQW